MNVSSISNQARMAHHTTSSLQSEQLADILFKYGIVGQRVDAVDDQGQTALVKAVAIGDLEGMKLLISKGANIQATNKAGHNILTIAVMNNHLFVTELLLNSGFSIHNLDKKLVNSSRALVNQNNYYEMRVLLERYGLPHRCT